MNTLDKQMIELLKTITETYSKVEDMRYKLSLLGAIYRDTKLTESVRFLKTVEELLTKVSYNIRDFWVKH